MAPAQVKLEDGVELALQARVEAAREKHAAARAPAHQMAHQMAEHDPEPEADLAAAAHAKPCSAAGREGQRGPSSRSGVRRPLHASSSASPSSAGPAGRAASGPGEGPAAHGVAKAKAEGVAAQAGAKAEAKAKVSVTAAPYVPPLIWFSGSGAVTAEWTGLLPGEAGLKLQADLDALEEAREYERYAALAEATLEASLRAAMPDDLVVRLWRQLVVTLNAFASRHSTSPSAS